MAALKGILKNDIFFSFGILKEYISLHCKYAKPAMTYLFEMGFFMFIRILIPQRYKAVVLSWILISKCVSGLATWRGNSLLLLYNSKFVQMPNPTNLEQKRSTVTSTSTLSANVKAIFVLIMLVLTIINPILFILPFIACFISAKKGGLL